jgi:hypothetical protein
MSGSGNILSDQYVPPSEYLTFLENNYPAAGYRREFPLLQDPDIQKALGNGVKFGREIQTRVFWDAERLVCYCFVLPMTVNIVISKIDCFECSKVNSVHIQFEQLF